MTKNRLATALLACAALLAGTPALAAKQDFTIINKTGYTISELYVSSAKSDDWEDDILGRDTLSNGDGGDISFEKGSKGCKWDLKVVYEDEEEAIWDALDLCKISTIVLRYDRKKGVTWAETE